MGPCSNQRVHHPAGYHRGWLGRDPVGIWYRTCTSELSGPRSEGAGRGIYTHAHLALAEGCFPSINSGISVLPFKWHGGLGRTLLLCKELLVLVIGSQAAEYCNGLCPELCPSHTYYGGEWALEDVGGAGMGIMKYFSLSSGTSIDEAFLRLLETNWSSEYDLQVKWHWGVEYIMKMMMTVRITHCCYLFLFVFT